MGSCTWFGAGRGDWDYRERERERCCAAWWRTEQRKDSCDVGVPTSISLLDNNIHMRVAPVVF